MELTKKQIKQLLFEKNYCRTDRPLKTHSGKYDRRYFINRNNNTYTYYYLPAEKIPKQRHNEFMEVKDFDINKSLRGVKLA